MTLGSKGVALNWDSRRHRRGSGGLRATHVDCPVEEAVIDHEHKVVSPPAYMLGPEVSDVRKDIKQLVDEVISLCD